uniref:hypothetical protein n=1 Tax=Trichocoleus desertorum TaxID=1481672 RepID=UPI0025B5AD1C|nr:hypothetical protein [Trichocoleus desertorum]
MAQLIVEVPDELASQLEQLGEPVQELVVRVLQQYVEVERNQFLMTQTRTWQLAGTLEVANPNQSDLAEQSGEGVIHTNYAEHVDDVLY